MPYRSDTIAATMKRLNTQYYLPAIQREFVWDRDKIVSLFDSVMRGYPIGSFLFWKLSPENTDRWQVYGFIHHASDAGTHNEIASINGVKNITLVLDGQQRLTALLVGLAGTYRMKLKHRRRDDPYAWVTQRLYLNLLKEENTDEEDKEIEIHYDFRFAGEKPDDAMDECWFQVARILDFPTRDKFDAFRLAEKDRLPEKTTTRQKRVFDRNVRRLYEAIWESDFINYYVETEQDYDRALDIF